MWRCGQGHWIWSHTWWHHRCWLPCPHPRKGQRPVSHWLPPAQRRKSLISCHIHKEFWNFILSFSPKLLTVSPHTQLQCFPQTVLSAALLRQRRFPELSRRADCYHAVHRAMHGELESPVTEVHLEPWVSSLYRGGQPLQRGLGKLLCCQLTSVSPSHITSNMLRCIRISW